MLLFVKQDMVAALQSTKYLLNYSPCSYLAIVEAELMGLSLIIIVALHQTGGQSERRVTQDIGEYIHAIYHFGMVTKPFPGMYLPQKSRCVVCSCVTCRYWVACVDKGKHSPCINEGQYQNTTMFLVAPITVTMHEASKYA